MGLGWTLPLKLGQGLTRNVRSQCGVTRGATYVECAGTHATSLLGVPRSCQLNSVVKSPIILMTPGIATSPKLVPTWCLQHIGHFIAAQTARRRCLLCEVCSTAHSPVLS
jgi:hypothetical protein